MVQIRDFDVIGLQLIFDKILSTSAIQVEKDFIKNGDNVRIEFLTYPQRPGDYPEYLIVQGDVKVQINNRLGTIVGYKH
jgi:hypothetical protein